MDCHGADCYKTAALFERFSRGQDAYGEITDTLYRHLTDENYVNSLGHTPCLENMPKELGHNYWHGWRGAPMYKIWLDGMLKYEDALSLLREGSITWQLVKEAIGQGRFVAGDR